MDEVRHHFEHTKACRGMFKVLRSAIRNQSQEVKPEPEEVANCNSTGASKKLQVIIIIFLTSTLETHNLMQAFQIMLPKWSMKGCSRTLSRHRNWAQGWFRLNVFQLQSPQLMIIIKTCKKQSAFQMRQPQTLSWELRRTSDWVDSSRRLAIFCNEALAESAHC